MKFLHVVLAHRNSACMKKKNPGMLTICIKFQGHQTGLNTTKHQIVEAMNRDEKGIKIWPGVGFKAFNLWWVFLDLYVHYLLQLYASVDAASMATETSMNRFCRNLVYTCQHALSKNENIYYKNIYKEPVSLCGEKCGKSVIFWKYPSFLYEIISFRYYLWYVIFCLHIFSEKTQVLFLDLWNILYDLHWSGTWKRNSCNMVSLDKFFVKLTIYMYLLYQK